MLSGWSCFCGGPLFAVRGKVVLAVDTAGTDQEAARAVGSGFHCIHVCLWPPYVLSVSTSLSLAVYISASSNVSYQQMIIKNRPPTREASRTLKVHQRRLNHLQKSRSLIYSTCVVSFEAVKLNDCTRVPSSLCRSASQGREGLGQ